MKKLQPYFPLITRLLRNLVIMAYRIGKQLVFPGRTRKGNILSSLFLFFTSTAEQIIGFRREFLQVPFLGYNRIPARERLDTLWRYGKSWLRKGMIVAAWVFFILSSFEWAGAPNGTDPRAESAAATIRISHAAAPEAANRETGDDREMNSFTGQVCASPVAAVIAASDARRWLLVCSIRI